MRAPVRLAALGIFLASLAIGCNNDKPSTSPPVDTNIQPKVGGPTGKPLPPAPPPPNKAPPIQKQA
jgi:hypothetical protein